MDQRRLIEKLEGLAQNTPCEIQLSRSRTGAKTILGYYNGIEFPETGDVTPIFRYWESKEAIVQHPSFSESVPITEVVDVTRMNYSN